MADNEEVHYERERSRSRDRGDSDHDEDRAPNGSQDDGYKNDRNGEERRQEEEQPEVHNLYVTNLSFQTTDESLKAAFEPYGDVHSASIIKEPVTRNSRGFGFVSFVSIDECEKALDAMHGADVDGRSIKVEKARRAGGYQKTPGVYLGPAGLSARFTRDDDRRGGDRYDRGGHRGGYDRDAPRGGGGYRGDYRDVRDRDPRGGYGGGGYMGGRDDGRYPPHRGGMPPAGYPGRSMPPGGMYRDDRGYGHEPRYDAYPRRDGPPPRFDDRGRGPPPMAMGGPRGGMPPAGYYDGPPRGGMPPGGPGPVGGPMGPGGPMMRGDRRSRSPPPGDSRGRPMGPPGGGAPGPGFDRGGPPSGGYGGGAGYYNAGAGAGGPPRGGRY